MARKQARTPTPVNRTVTAERAARLYRLLKILAREPQTRAALLRHLGLDVRGFYRDLELLRELGIVIELDTSRYVLQQKMTQAIDLLPFPDPGLTLGEARLLAKGRSAVHRKLKQQLDRIIA